MNYEGVLANLHINKKLNESGLRDYITLLKGHLIDAKLKITSLENELMNKGLRKK